MVLGSLDNTRLVCEGQTIPCTEHSFSYEEYQKPKHVLKHLKMNKKEH